MSEPTANTAQLGKYSLLRKLAQGGMAEIFLAEQQGPGGFTKQLVIKRILPHLSEDKSFVDMFLDEARIAAQFNHPNIVQIFDLGQVEGAYFIAMEYIDGRDLSQIIERAIEFGKRVPTPIAAKIIADALGALHYAHAFRSPSTGDELHLVHRDISPQNILVNRDGIAKLVDFGVAKAKTSSSKTQTGAVKGKFSYMAPEQIAGAPLDGRCDLFAMGIVLYELLLGVRPFGEHSDLMAITAIVHQPPKNPREIDDSFPAELEHIIMRALAKDRNERYSTAQDMQRDLEMYLQRCGLLISSREVSAYLESLFSDNPNLDAIGLGASHTHDILISSLQSAAQTSTGATPAKTQPGGSRPRATGRVGSTDDDPKPSGGGTGGLVAVLVVVGLLVLGGGGYLAYMMLGKTDGGAEAASDSNRDKTGKEAQADVAEAKADVAEAKADVAEALTDGPDASVAAIGDLGAPSQPDAAVVAVVDAVAAVPDAGPSVPDTTAGVVAAADVVEDASVEGEPAVVEVAKADTSHIVEDKLEGVSSNVAAGFGEIRLKTNLKAKAVYRGSTVGKLPATLSLKAGDHELKLVSLDKESPAEKVVSVHVYDRRKYEVDVPFEKGTLSLQIEPAKGFDVVIDGKKVGSSPLGPIELWEGVHKVELLDIASKKKRNYSITVQPGDNPRRIRVRR